MKNIILLTTGLLFFSLTNAQVKLVKIWETDSTLKVPESVLYDAANKVLYVSNIDGTEPWGKDGKGSIGKVSLDGKIINAAWVTGLNAPKGMGLYKGKLYVADLTEIVVIDIAKGKIVGHLPINGAMGLNDISIDAKGGLYVSDSKAREVYLIPVTFPKKMSLLLDSNQLKRPNGVLIHGNNFYVLDDGTMYRLEKNNKLTKITDGMEGGTDGIENVQGNDFIVSCWSGTVWYVKADGSKELLLDTHEQKINSADIGYDAKNKIVYVPTFWKNSVVAYQLQ
jgi:DNA-binding beta-propeller fold protein YncE